jgi:hypothetical protein
MNIDVADEQYRFVIKDKVRYLTRLRADVYITDGTGYRYYQTTCSDLNTAHEYFLSLSKTISLIVSVFL